jgi:type II secretory pathway pseudopilin PulG
MISHPRPSVRRRSGITLVESALLICVVGVVLAVSVPTFIDTVRVSKVAEATTHLGELYRVAAAYYAATHRVRGAARYRCLPPAAGPAPQKPSPEPVEVDFAAGETPGSATWRALRFQPATPIRYRYSFLPPAAGCRVTPPTHAAPIVLRAEGDLDGDGEYSKFERTVVAGKSGELVPTRLLRVTDRVE